jgi:hypothetical protein
VNRCERRARSREIRELTGRARSLHGQLLMTDQVLRGAKERGEEVVASAHREIDAYVDAQARVVALDVELVADDADDVRVLEVMVDWAWRNVRTVEQARRELDEEVARRSIGKGDLALLFSSIDHTARRLYETLPDVDPTTLARARGRPHPDEGGEGRLTMDSMGRPEATRDRTVVECEHLAEQNGFRCMVAGYFPDLPLPPVPRFLRAGWRAACSRPRTGSPPGTCSAGAGWVYPKYVTAYVDPPRQPRHRKRVRVRRYANRDRELS